MLRRNKYRRASNLGLQSFQNIRQWFDYVREERGYDVLSVLIANKIDITDDR